MAPETGGFDHQPDLHRGVNAESELLSDEQPRRGDPSRFDEVEGEHDNRQERKGDHGVGQAQLYLEREDGDGADQGKRREDQCPPEGVVIPRGET